MNGESALLTARAVASGSSSVLLRPSACHLNKAACPSCHLYFTRLYLGQLLLKQLMHRSAKVSCKVSLKQLVKVSADQVDRGANSHLPAISQALAVLLLLFHQKNTIIIYLIYGP